MSKSKATVQAKTVRRSQRLFVSLTRGLAAFFAFYSLFSVAAAAFGDAYNQNAWWIDLSFLPDPLSVLVQLALTVALGFFAFHIPKHVVTSIVLVVPVLICLFAAVRNTMDVYALAASGTITLGFPIPFSLFVCCALSCIIIGIVRGCSLASRLTSSRRLATLRGMGFSFVAALILFPIGQMHCFGTTDYHVEVDAVVVLGARVYSDGTPSPVLQDRLDTAIAFYKEGHAPVLFMSGGIDEDGTSEAQAMRNYAVSQGVAVQDIIIDEQGSNTKQTARNTVDTLRAAGMTKVATVSNFYHLARIKMLYLAEGMDVVTVPSVPVKDPSYPLLNVVREIPAWWYYWFLNLVE